MKRITIIIASIFIFSLSGCMTVGKGPNINTSGFEKVSGAKNKKTRL